MSETKMIKDSGTRRTFNTGAVRDMQDGKGRNDLLHPGVMLFILRWVTTNPLQADTKELMQLRAKEYLYAWYEGNPCKVELPTIANLALAYMCACHMLLGNGLHKTLSPLQMFVTGTVELSKHYEKGAKKYGDHNWSKGIPSISFYDSAHRHLDKDILGLIDEPHIEAMMFNIVGLIYNHLYRKDLEVKIYEGGKRKQDDNGCSKSDGTPAYQVDKS